MNVQETLNRSRVVVSPLAVVGLVVLLTGCITAGPDYVEPELETPDAWHTAATEGLAEGEASLQTWWKVFENPQLDSLIERALESNLSLELALWRVEEARALRGVAAGARVPQVDFSGESSRSEPSDKGALGDLAPPGGFDAQNLHDYNIGAVWELDLFGRIRRSVESADASLQASVEDYRDVLVSLLAEVALNYVDVRSLQERIQLANANVEAQLETLGLTQDRFKTGLVSALDVAQAESNLANTESLIPTLETQLQLALNRLAVLLGQAPGAVHAELEEVHPLPSEPQDVTVGLPANLLRQRPDVRRAERQLAAQTARVGVATADLYPTFSLGGFLGVQATSSGDLTSSDSLTWGVGLPIRWNLFAGGRIRSQIRAEEARTEQAMLAYELTVLFALEETEGAMVAYENEQIRRSLLARSVDATERSLELVLTQYRAGLTDFQNVLDTQRTLLNRQDDLAASRGQVVRNLIALYRSLGGGWTPTEEPEEPTP
jgi:NodT family efflux transporter outer membrane factor (OMF) lipoprotein